MSATAAIAAMVAATSALRASGAHIDALSFTGELLVCIGAAMIAWVVICIWCDRS